METITDENRRKTVPPIVAATMQNTMRLSELIALQKGEPFDKDKELKEMLIQWESLTKDLTSILP